MVKSEPTTLVVAAIRFQGSDKFLMTFYCCDSWTISSIRVEWSTVCTQPEHRRSPQVNGRSAQIPETAYVSDHRSVYGTADH